jgi:hypothetical protein
VRRRAGEPKQTVKARGHHADLVTLAGYLVGELELTAETALEEHMRHCDTCQQRLHGLDDLRDGVVEMARAGGFFTSATNPTLDRHGQGGLKLTDERLRVGESVRCSLAPVREIEVRRIRGRSAWADSLDLKVSRAVGQRNGRMECFEHVDFSQDLAIDRDTRDLVLMCPGQTFHFLPRGVFRLQLLACQGELRRNLGVYTLRRAFERRS